MANRVPRAQGLHPNSGTMSTAGGMARLLQGANQVAEETNRATANSPLLNGRLVTGVAVGTIAAARNHGLGRTPQGWFIVDKTIDVNVWRTAWDNRTITLDATSSATIAIYVF